MPHSRSAKKRVRQNLTRAARNRDVRGAVRTIERRIQELLDGGKKAEAKAQLPEAYARLDKAAKHGVMHANTAGNHKAKLARRTAT